MRPRCWNQRQIGATTRIPTAVSPVRSAHAAAARTLCCSLSRRRIVGWPADPGARCRRQCGDRMCVARLDRGALTRFVEALEGVLAEQRMHVEPRLAAAALAGLGRLDPDEALVRERFESFEHVHAEVA